MYIPRIQSDEKVTEKEISYLKTIVVADSPQALHEHAAEGNANAVAARGRVGDISFDLII